MEELWAYFKDPATPLGPIDMVWILYLFYGFFRGMFRGMPRELAGMLGTCLTLWGSWRFYGPVSSTIRTHTRLESETASSVLAYALIVLLLLVAWKTVTYLVMRTLDLTCPDQLQRWGGAFLGLSKSLVVICVILTAVNLSGFDTLRTELIRHSWFGRTTQQILPDALHRAFPAVFPEPVPDPATAPPPPPEDDGSGDA